MNTKQIRCILELARTQNFNRAAENLFISQPTLTYQLKAAGVLRARHQGPAAPP